MTAARELVDVVDDTDRVIGRATRAEMRSRNLLHRAVYILVVNGAGRLFVHQRTASKDVYPSYWDVTVGGVVDAGESYEDAAARELAEEIGARGTLLRPLGPFRYADAATRLLGRVFLTTYDGPMTLQAEEIARGSFVSLAAAEHILAEERCCPDGARVFAEHRAELARVPRPT